MSKKYLLMTLTSPKPGREDEYNEWYSNKHLDDLVACPGVESAQRYRITNEQRREPPHPFQYMALYEIVTDDLQSVLDTIGERSGTSMMPISDAMAESRLGLVFEPFGQPKSA